MKLNKLKAVRMYIYSIIETGHKDQRKDSREPE